MDTENMLPCGIEDVISLTGIEVVRKTGTQLDCRCPFCDDKKAHMNVNLKGDVFRCNRCGTGGGVIQLYAKLKNKSIKSARDELYSISRSGELERIRKKSRKSSAGVVEKAVLAESSVRNDTYVNLLSLLSLSKTHRRSLHERGLSDDDIDELSYRTTPAVRGRKIVKELLRRGCVLEGVPGFYKDAVSGKWKIDIRGTGIMIPDRNAFGEIEAIQIRLDSPFGSKYNNLSSVDRHLGTSAACCPHFAGVDEYTDTVYITEGVLKSDAAVCLSRKLGMHMAFVGLTGVANHNQYIRALEEIERMGIRNIRIAYDMDALTNENVCAAKNRAIETADERNFTVTPVCWTSAHKGIDDLIYSFVNG